MEENYRGTIDYFRLSKEKHKGPYSDSKQIPIVEIGLRNEQGLHEVNLPVDIPNNPFSVRLIENDLLGQEALYQYEYKQLPHGFSGPSWIFEISSGKFKGVQYCLEELIDF